MLSMTPSEMDPSERYFLLTGTVLPRPVAWVTTLFADGQVNLAPYSQFMILASDPGILGFAVGPGPDGRVKDTLVNAQRESAFVINIAGAEMAQHVQDSSDDPGEGVSEVKNLGLRTVPSKLVTPPRLKVAAVAFECVLESVTPYGNGPSSLVAGRIVQAHLREGLYDSGRVDIKSLDPLGRLQGQKFARLGEIIEC